MLAYPWFAAKQWQGRDQRSAPVRLQMEIEALSNKDISFVTDVLHPQKISQKDWLV